MRHEKTDDMIDKLTEQKIKDAANIVEVMSDFITLKRIGARYTCLCPFHDDHNLGSFSVYPRGNVYKCFSCNAGGDSIKFLMEYEKLSYPDALRYLATKYGIYIDEDYDKEKFKNIKPAKPREMFVNPNDLPKRTWPIEYIGYYKYLAHDNLVSWLREQKWDGCQRTRLEEALQDYHVGHQYYDYYGQHHEYTIWWQLDENNVLHNAHLMEYKQDGHRDKERKYTQTWLHAIMKRANKNPFDENKERASYCLFGQHLLNKWPHAPINIVESEKTAIIMAAAYGNNAAGIWMACCGMQNLTVERLAPLMATGRPIVLWPDRDGIERWSAKAQELDYINMNINTQLVKGCWIEADGPKADCGDVILRIINT